MANLEQIMAETSKSYDASRNALNDQINAIAGDLEAQKGRINAQYAQQSKNLDNQRNFQAQASSMAASNNGGSFGGSAEIANKKFYQQSYVPAVTQMQTNQANDISSAESQANANRLSLQNTLANLNSEAEKYALQRYDAALAAEEQKRQFNEQLKAQKEAAARSAALQRQQIAAQNAYTKYLQNAGKGGGGSTYKNWDFGKGYSVQEMPNGQAYYYKDGKQISAGQFLSNTGANWNKWKDIWANGVQTAGVGSDTISAFQNRGKENLADYTNYQYLFKI